MNRRELEQYTQGMADGILSAEEIRLLESELRTNASSRDFYRRSMRAEFLLGEAVQRRAQPSSHKITDYGMKRRKRKTLMRAVLATAALLAFSAMILQWISLREGATPDIRVTFSPGTSWSGPVDKDGTMNFGESVKIEFGVAQFDLPGDVRAVIEGPAEVRLPSAGLLELREGSGWFRVGKAGQGFRVRTPSVEVLDYGTEFGLLTRPNEYDSVHVFEGSVNCGALFAMKEKQDLMEGQALGVSPAGRWIEQELDEERFLKSLPPQLPGIHFSFDGEDPLKAEGAYPAVEEMKVQTRGGSSPKLVVGVKGKALSVRNVADVAKTDWQGIGGAAPRTIACWIRPDGGNDSRFSAIVSWGDPNGSRPGRCQIMMAKSQKSGDAVLRFALGAYVNFSGRTPIVPGEWQHIAVVFRGTGNIDGEMVELYVNGNREKMDPEFSNPPKNDGVIRTVITGTNAQPLQIGCGPYSKGRLAPFYGDIDEVWIMPRALSAREVQGLMNR